MIRYALTCFLFVLPGVRGTAAPKPRSRLTESLRTEWRAPETTQEAFQVGRDVFVQLKAPSPVDYLVALVFTARQGGAQSEIENVLRDVFDAAQERDLSAEEQMQLIRIACVFAPGLESQHHLAERPLNWLATQAREESVRVEARRALESIREAQNVKCEMFIVRR